MVYEKLYCGIHWIKRRIRVTEIISPVSLTPIWVHIVNVLQVLLLLWFGFVLLLGSWKLFRFLVKWRP